MDLNLSRWISQGNFQFWRDSKYKHIIYLLNKQIKLPDIYQLFQEPVKNTES